MALKHYAKASEEGVRVRSLPWMPDEMGWRLDIGKQLLRKDPRYRPLHEMLIEYTAKGTINRMEEVSLRSEAHSFGTLED